MGVQTKNTFPVRLWIFSGTTQHSIKRNNILVEIKSSLVRNIQIIQIKFVNNRLILNLLATSHIGESCYTVFHDNFS